MYTFKYISVCFEIKDIAYDGYGVFDHVVLVVGPCTQLYDKRFNNDNDTDT